MMRFACAILGFALAAAPALAQTAIQPGLWEVADKTTLEGVQSMPATSRKVCVKGDVAGVTANARVTYKPDSYEGVGSLLVKDKAGATLKGSSLLTGRRIGDC